MPGVLSKMFGFFGVGPSGLAFFACCVPGRQRKMFGFGLLLPGGRGITRIFVRVFGLHTRETCLAAWSNCKGKAFGLRVLQTIVRVSGHLPGSSSLSNISVLGKLRRFPCSAEKTRTIVRFCLGNQPGGSCDTFFRFMYFFS